jgi:hypothetical protein
MLIKLHMCFSVLKEHPSKLFYEISSVCSAVFHFKNAMYLKKLLQNVCIVCCIYRVLYVYVLFFASVMAQTRMYCYYLSNSELE